MSLGMLRCRYALLSQRIVAAVKRNRVHSKRAVGHFACAAAWDEVGAHVPRPIRLVECGIQGPSALDVFAARSYDKCCLESLSRFYRGEFLLTYHLLPITVLRRLFASVQEGSWEMRAVLGLFLGLRQVDLRDRLEASAAPLRCFRNRPNKNLRSGKLATPDIGKGRRSVSWMQLIVNLLSSLGAGKTHGLGTHLRQVFYPAGHSY